MVERIQSRRVSPREVPEQREVERPRTDRLDPRDRDSFQRVRSPRARKPRAVGTPPRRRSPPPNDDISFIGMNPTGRREADELRRRSGKKVSFIGDSNGQITRNGKTYNLRTREGIDDFTRTFGLPEEQRKKVADAIERADENSRDELAQLAEQWAVAERGGTIPSRLVISGHSTGSGIWGDNNGTLSLDALRDLTKAMPRAAGQIRHVHLAACYTGGRKGIDRWREMFPNAKTIFAYSGSAPGADSGSSAHLSRWERATRGDTDSLDPRIVHGTRKGENVDTWSERDGYKLVATANLEQLRRRYEASREEADKYFRGEKTVTDPQSGPLRDHYNTIQALLRNSELPPEERQRLEKERDQIIRLLYYSKSIGPQFQKNYEQQLRDGYRALGLEPPDFSKLSRADALAELERIEKLIRADSPAAAQELLRLLRGLRDLDRAVIPNGWIGASPIQRIFMLENPPPLGRR